MARQIILRTHDLDDEQRAQLTRALSHFHEAQQVIQLVHDGSAALSLRGDAVDVEAFFRHAKHSPSLVAVTGRRLADNWFTHANSGSGLVSLADWEVAFIADAAGQTVASPDANILTSLALVVLLVVGRRNDHELLHNSLTGCLFDLCMHKPDRVLKMRAAFVCAGCTSKLASTGTPSMEIDAVCAILDRVRHLILGRAPQAVLPTVTNDDEFIQKSAKADVQLPPRLIEGCVGRGITLFVGSGLSLQTDVQVAYRSPLPWTRLPTWGEVPSRMSECLKRYRGKNAEPRATESLDEFLADLDYFRESLGDSVYYPRAVFDIFTPHVTNAGVANRLLFRFPCTSVLTTNYDFVLSYAAPAGTPTYTWREARSAREYLSGGAEMRPILKLHGCASRPDTVVLTRLEYERLAQQEEYISLMRSLFEQHTTLFVGFGLNDPRDLDHVLRQARFAGAAEGEKFAILPADRCAEVRSKFPQVQTIPYKEHKDVAIILAKLCAIAA